MWKAGELLPSQKPDSMMRCPCGETFDSHQLEHNLVHVPHITAAAEPMKFTADRPFADPEKAARKLIEIASTVESVQEQEREAKRGK
jgi:hypothetical protein